MYLTLLWPRKWILSFISHEQINLLDQCPELGPDILSVYGLNVFWSTKAFENAVHMKEYSFQPILIHFRVMFLGQLLIHFWSSFAPAAVFVFFHPCSSSPKKRNESGSKINLCPFKRSDTISKILLDSLIRKAFPFNFDQRKSSTFARKSWLELEQTE